MAFVALMSGVCRSDGTLVMTWNPTNPARTKTYSSMREVACMLSLPDLSTVGDGHGAGDLVGHVELGLPLLVEEVLQQRLEVPAVGLARVERQGGRHVERPEDVDARDLHRL